ncbi:MULTISPECIES: phage baseplate protein [Caproicibacterium]|uniref:Dit-like phage tail protein N-terminal domain-containing protein n=1 Tax=Caproicibacterium argilliputei TaxID=3030016 RepID=A0AA97DC32_9FIRM|nr:hypothetical protein [Caproicibacterium argilliputei]WOC33059.1 hypothetical protein PXC00_04045 [Caproicibacterium argilliputei]
MATLGGLEIWIDSEGEQAERTAEVTSHPVESGIDVSDNIRRSATVLNLTGEIVGTDAVDKLQRIEAWKNAGTVVAYHGVYSYSRMWITKFNTAQSSKIVGGYKFDITLQEARIAKSAYTSSSTRKSTGTQQKKTNSASQKVYYTTKAGDTLWALLQAPNAPYKKYGFTPNDVMKNNPKAFSRKMDARTMQNGVKIWIGNRK